MADRVYPPVIAAFRTLWRGLGLRFDFQGVENLPLSGGAVIAMNHISYVDFAVVGTAALRRRRYIRFMAKKEIFDNRYAGPLMRGMHHIAVDREKGSTSLVAAMRALRGGELVGIFPEATISQSFEVKALKSGAVRLAQGSQTPIIPTAIWGSQRIYTKGHKPSLKRAKIPVTVIFGQPYLVSKDADVAAAEQELKDKLRALVEQARLGYPDSPVANWWAPASQGGSAPALTSEEM
jgi:1-acyl-sn-glycerol-3-phosphate acyltransferase